jgi:hypothetical protein
MERACAESRLRVSANLVKLFYPRVGCLVLQASTPVRLDAFADIDVAASDLPK